MVKPINIQEVIDLINKFSDKEEDEESDSSMVRCFDGRLMVPDGNGFEVVNVDDIIRLEAVQNYTKFTCSRVQKFYRLST